MSRNGILLPPTIFRSTRKVPFSIFTILYEFSKNPRTLSDEAVPAFAIDSVLKSQIHGLCLCPHRTRFTLESQIVRNTSPASIAVSLSEPVSGIPIK